MKRGIPRKKKHELKTRKGGSCKDKSMKGFHKRMTISTGGKIAIKKIFWRIQRRLLMAHGENHFEIKRAQVFICLDILFPLSSFLIFTPPCMFEPYFFF